jgi:hypothetical protein
VTARTFTDADIRTVCSRLRMSHTYAAEPVDVAETADVIEYLFRQVAGLRAERAAVEAIRDDLRRTTAPEPATSDFNRGQWGMAHEVADRLDTALDGVVW